MMVERRYEVGTETFEGLVLKHSQVRGKPITHEITVGHHDTALSAANACESASDGLPWVVVAHRVVMASFGRAAEASDAEDAERG